MIALNHQTWNLGQPQDGKIVSFDLMAARLLSCNYVRNRDKLNVMININ